MLNSIRHLLKVDGCGGLSVSDAPERDAHTSKRLCKDRWGFWAGQPIEMAMQGEESQLHIDHLNVSPVS